MSLKVHRMFYAATGGTYYCIIVDQASGNTRNSTTGEFEVNPSAVNAGIDCSEVSPTKYQIKIPDTLVGMNVDIVIYRQVGGSKDFTADTVIQSYGCSVGSIFGF